MKYKKNILIRQLTKASIDLLIMESHIKAV